MQLDIMNFYEPMVVERIKKVLTEQQLEFDNDFVTDIACVALNSLPPRYVRHAVDATFYMSSEELATTTLAISDAVDAAIQYVQKRPHAHPDGSKHR